MLRRLTGLLPVLTVVCILYLSTGSHASPLVGPAITVAQLILKGSMEMGGLDKAGRYFLGSSWPGFKTVLGPVIEEFPDLLSGNTEKSRIVTQEAIDALKSDPRFHALIESHMQKTAATTTDLWIRVDAVEMALTDHERRLSAIEKAVSTDSSIVIPVARYPREKDSFKRAMSTLIKEAPSEFAALCGTCRGKNFSGNCVGSDTIVTLPGARSCQIIARIPGADDKIVRCNFFDSTISFTYPKGTTPYDVARGRAKADAVKIFSPSREEALLAFVQLAKRVDEHIPPHWKREFPKDWVMDPARWPDWKERDRAIDRSSWSRGLSPMRREEEKSSQNSFYYIASEPGGGRRVWVTYDHLYLPGDKPLISVQVDFQPLPRSRRGP